MFEFLMSVIRLFVWKSRAIRHRSAAFRKKRKTSDWLSLSVPLSHHQ
jgi:hypothetical protein